MPDLLTMFLSRRVKSDILWSISKNKTMEESMKQNLEIKDIISINVLNLIQEQNLDLSEQLLIDYPNSKDFRLFIYRYTKKKVIKMYTLAISFFTEQK